MLQWKSRLLSLDTPEAFANMLMLCNVNVEVPLLQGTVAAGFKSAGVLYSTGTRRLMVYEVEFGQTGGLSTSDCQCQWDLSRFSQTAALVASSVAVNLLDPGDATALALFFNAVTVELTYTTPGNGSALKSWGINQRGSYRWRALDDGDNIIVPATNLAGIGVRTLSVSFTGSAIGNISAVER